MITSQPAIRELPRFLLAILFIVLGLVLSLWILRPFLSALVWAALVVVSTWPLLLMLQAKLGGKRSRAVMAMSIGLLLIVVLPAVFGVLAIADHTDDVAAKLQSVSKAGVPAPPAWVEKIPA